MIFIFVAFFVAVIAFSFFAMCYLIYVSCTCHENGSGTNSQINANATPSVHYVARNSPECSSYQEEEFPEIQEPNSYIL